MAIFSTLSFAGPLLPSAQIMRVELFEHAGRGTVGENVRNLAKLPAILLPAHVHAAANQAVITPASGSRCHGSVAFQHCCLRRRSICTFTPSSFSRGTVPRAMPSPNFELTTVEPALSTCPSASVSGWPRWRLQGCHARGAALGTKERRVCSRAEGGAATGSLLQITGN